MILNNFILKTEQATGCCPLLATWETEIRRIAIPRSAQAKMLVSQQKQLGMVAATCQPSDGGKHKIRLWSRPVWAKGETLSPKITRSKKVGSVAHVVEQLCTSIKP
jgi:hypothetical protein